MDYGRPVQFGYFIIPDATEPMRALGQAISADEAGIDLIGIQDHPYQHRFHDTWTLLSVVAARTSRVTVFPDVANLPLRPPAMLAKAAASLDLLSNGRVELGLGAGGFWPAIQAMGGPSRTAGESVSALEEAIEVIRLMWSGGRGLRFDGRFYQLAGLNAGAYRPRMLRLIGRAADGWVPSLGYLTPQQLGEAGARIDDAAREAGRDPSAIRRVLNVGGDLTAEDFATIVLEHGFDTFMTGPDAGDAFIEEVVPKVRELVAEGRGTR